MQPTAILIGLLLPTCIAGGQDSPASPPPNIAVVNLPLIFERYRMTKDLEERFDQRSRAVRAEAENRRQAMDNRLAALEAFDPASKDYAERREELLRTQIEYRVWLEFEEQRLRAENKAWLVQIYQEVREAVARAAEQRGIDLVLTYDELFEDVRDSDLLRQQILLKKVLFFSERLDLTELVGKDLNDQYAKRGGAASLADAPPPPPLPARPQKRRPPPESGTAP